MEPPQHTRGIRRRPDLNGFSGSFSGEAEGRRRWRGLFPECPGASSARATQSRTGCDPRLTEEEVGWPESPLVLLRQIISVSPAHVYVIPRPLLQTAAAAGSSSPWCQRLHVKLSWRVCERRSGLKSGCPFPAPLAPLLGNPRGLGALFIAVNSYLTQRARQVFKNSLFSCPVVYRCHKFAGGDGLSTFKAF